MQGVLEMRTRFLNLIKFGLRAREMFKLVFFLFSRESILHRLRMLRPILCNFIFINHTLYTTWKIPADIFVGFK